VTSPTQTHRNLTPKILAALLDSLTVPVLFADTEHIICFLNKAAADQYEKGFDLVGMSLLDCHNAESREIMQDILTEMRQGLSEKLITDNEKHRIYMRAVRDKEGKLLGYFERYESPSI